MIKQEVADYLLELPKHIVEDERYLDTINYTPALPIDDRLFLLSKNDADVSFFINIYQSKKYILKITFHFQEKDASIPLLRLDFNGRHKNPEITSDNVPKIFEEYAGKWIEDSHIHYFIEGYKPLAWALPLKADSSMVIKDYSDVYSLGNIIDEFGKKVNLQTVIKTTIQTALL